MEDHRGAMHDMRVLAVAAMLLIDWPKTSPLIGGRRMAYME